MIENTEDAEDADRSINDAKDVDRSINDAIEDAKYMDHLIDDVERSLVYYLDVNVYIPVKEELVDVEHSLGIRKELFKNYIVSEMERLKTELNKIDTDRREGHV